MIFQIPTSRNKDVEERTISMLIQHLDKVVHRDDCVRRGIPSAFTVGSLKLCHAACRRHPK